MLIKSLIFVTAVIMAGCSSAPREVTPSVPLVTFIQTKPSKKEIPSKYWNALSNPLKREIQHDKYKVRLATLYTSALGLLCRELIIEDKDNRIEKRIACETHFINESNKQDKAWFMEKLIIESSSYVEL